MGNGSLYSGFRFPMFCSCEGLKRRGERHPVVSATASKPGKPLSQVWHRQRSFPTFQRFHTAAPAMIA